MTDAQHYDDEVSSSYPFPGAADLRHAIADLEASPLAAVYAIHTLAEARRDQPHIDGEAFRCELAKLQAVIQQTGEYPAYWDDVIRQIHIKVSRLLQPIRRRPV